MKEKKRPCLAKSTFLYSMWKEQFPDVVIPGVRKCSLIPGIGSHKCVGQKSAQRV